jgi:hypothetical protein
MLLSEEPATNRARIWRMGADPEQSISENSRPILLLAFVQSPLRPVVDRRLVVCQLCQLPLADMDAVGIGDMLRDAEMAESAESAK